MEIKKGQEYKPEFIELIRKKKIDEGKSLVEIAKELNLKYRQVEYISRQYMNNKPIKKFTFKEVDFIENNYKNMTARQIAEKLNRNHKSVEQKILRLGLTKEECLMYKKDINTMKKSIASKFLKMDRLETSIKLNPNLKLQDTSLGIDKRPSKRVPRSKRK